MAYEPELIVPDWPAPEGIRAISTTRAGGFSCGPWSSFNLGAHVGDNSESVSLNRQKLAKQAGVPASGLQFLDQVHGTDIVELPASPPVQAVQADACVTSRALTPCIIMAADCLPVLFCNCDGTRVAAAHAGWRGLCRGVLERTVMAFDKPSDVMAWLGPAIGPGQFEVGAEVRDAFIKHDPEAAQAFQPGVDEKHFFGDLYRLARQRLGSAGVTQIYGGHWCTFSETERFFSYRRDGVTGRMASMIYIS